MTQQPRRVVLAALLTLGGCGLGGGGGAYVPADAPFGSAKADLAGRAAQIRRAATGLGWAVSQTGPGTIVATMLNEDRPLSVAITFTTDRYLLTPRPPVRSGDGDTLRALDQAINAQSGV
jgi:hypothetical protein